MMDSVFFIASKVFGFGLKIEVWLLALAIVVAIATLRDKRLLATRASLALVVAFIILGVFPVGDLGLAPLENEHAIPQTLVNVAGIVVLGGGEDVLASLLSGQPQLGEGADRYVAALALATQFPNARVLFTGGSGRLRDVSGHAVSEAAIAREIFQGQGLSSDRLLFEETSRNTAENARLSHALAEPKADEQWVLVTSAFHMPRAFNSFQAAGWQDIVPYPVDFRSHDWAKSIGWDFQRNLVLCNIVVREWVGRFVYKVAGR